MNLSVFQDINEGPIHFIGIGGIGMSGIAEVLISLGFRVSGSDLARTSVTEKLEKQGATIFYEHSAVNIAGSMVVVYSSAIRTDNPEFMAAQASDIPLLRRAEMLAEIMRLKFGIAIAGTHGKTTTSAVLATILKEVGKDPSYMIGGVVHNLEGHAKVGDGEYLVAEADESDGSFLNYNPILSLITNIDADHMDFYSSFDRLVQAFLDFANRIPFYGICVLNAHDRNLMEIRRRMKRRSRTFSMSEEIEADYQGLNVRYEWDYTEFDLYYQKTCRTTIRINTSGAHNVLNTLGAIALAHQVGIEFDSIAQALKNFTGVGRRFNTVYSGENITVIDDYAHHPTAIQSVISAARAMDPSAEIIVLFEPHRYTRTRDCWQMFYHCFNAADKVIVGPIYPASEKPILGIEADVLCSDINKIHPSLCEYRPDLQNIDDLLVSSNKKKLILALGAGKISQLIREKMRMLFI